MYPKLMFGAKILKPSFFFSIKISIFTDEKKICVYCMSKFSMLDICLNVTMAAILNNDVVLMMSAET